MKAKPDDTGRHEGPHQTGRGSRWNCGKCGEQVELVRRRKSRSYAWSQLVVFIGEHEDRIDDGHFLTGPKPDDRRVNLPARRYDQARVLPITDGHSEQWKWRWQRHAKYRTSYWKRVVSSQDVPGPEGNHPADIRRVSSSALTAVRGNGVLL